MKNTLPTNPGVLRNSSAFGKKNTLNFKGVLALFLMFMGMGVSWGQTWPMTRRFWNTYVDEAYLVADPAWIEATGHTPANMTAQEFLWYLAQA